MNKQRGAFQAAILVFFCFAQVELVEAAACCGGGAGVPSLIVGDEKIRVSGQLSDTLIVDDIDQNGVWRKRDNSETDYALKLDSSLVFHDRWQFGAGLSMLRRTLAGRASTGLGDSNLLLGYEALPDWDYNPWRPHTVIFIDVTVPTGRPSDEANAPLLLDSRGRGFWAAGFGSVFTKSFGSYDSLLSFELHKSLNRTLSGGGVEKPGYGGVLTLGGGVTFVNWRYGATLTWLYEDAVDTTALGAGNTYGSPQRFATATISVHFAYSSEDSFNLAIADQTLFGDPMNTTLGRSVMFSAERRWPR